MLLLLVRHAHAGDRDPDRWPDDRDRPLTDKGRKTQRQVSRALGELRPRADPGAHQPLDPRGADGGDPGRASSACPSPPIPCAALAADPDLSRLADDIGEPGPDAIVALVGHSPWIEELAALLLTGQPTGLRMDYPKSGVMGIDLEKPAAGAGELRFFLRPKMV